MVQLLIPFSETVQYFNKERQLQLAAKLRSLVTRTAYKAFTMNIELFPTEYGDAKSRIRSAALQVAKEKRFRGVIFSDITGNLNLLRLGNQTPERSMRPPVFYPLLAFGIADLFELCRSVGISENDLLSQITLEKEYPSYGKEAAFPEKLGDLMIQEISL